MPEDEFYLSIAPYISKTHDCYNHSLSGCTGELTDTEINISIYSENTNYYQNTYKTSPKGFFGFWLPKDEEFTIEVSYEGKNSLTSVSTNADDKTCLTTMQLI